MRKDDKQTIDPSQPALIVTNGNTSRKVRPLDADVLVLGRNPACNVNLVAPDVAPIHCVLARVVSGWMLRDTSGRPGTRVNGKVVRETLLDDGDSIQVGAFSFEVRLPPGQTAQAAAVPPAQVAHFQHSRRNLVRLALKLRKRLGERALSVEEADTRLRSQRGELDQQVELLRARQREFELRMTRLELSERDLATDRATLDKEFKAFQEEAERHAQGVKLFQERVAAKEKELEEREASAASHRPAPTEGERDRGEGAGDADEEARKLLERSRALDRRAEELDRFAEHLRRQQAAAAAAPAPAATAPATPAGAATPSQAELLLCRQKTEFERLVADLRQLVEETRAGHKEQAEVLRRDNERLRRDLAEQERRRNEAVTLLDDRTQAARERIDLLSGEVDQLRRDLTGKKAELEQLKQSPGEAGSRRSRSVDTKRAALEEEVRKLRERTAELEEVAREAELSLSRERAQMSRERAEFLRLREEQRHGQDRKRGSGIRDRIRS